MVPDAAHAGCACITFPQVDAPASHGLAEDSRRTPLRQETAVNGGRMQAAAAVLPWTWRLELKRTELQQG
jgi:hypothetical protein